MKKKKIRAVFEEKSFRSQVIGLANPMLRHFADDIEDSLKSAIDRTVRDFFVLRNPGAAQTEQATERPASPLPDGNVEHTAQTGQAAERPASLRSDGNVPVGFKRLGCVSKAGWFNMKKFGNILQGTLEGMFERRDDLHPGKKSNFFQIKVTQSCEVRMGTGEEARLAEAKPGDYVNVNYGPKTMLLEPLIPQLTRGAEFEVWGKVLGEKIQLEGGRSMYNFDLFQRMTKLPVNDDEPGFDDAGKAMDPK